MFTLKIGISVKLGNNKNYPGTSSIGNGPVQIFEVEESTRHKWVNYSYFASADYLLRLISTSMIALLAERSTDCNAGFQRARYGAAYRITR